MIFTLKNKVELYVSCTFFENICSGYRVFPLTFDPRPKGVRPSVQSTTFDAVSPRARCTNAAPQKHESAVFPLDGSGHSAGSGSRSGLVSFFSHSHPQKHVTRPQRHVVEIVRKIYTRVMYYYYIYYSTEIRVKRAPPYSGLSIY